jgi:hypothetical protein
MVSRKWTNRDINDTLQRLGACYELPPERSAALEARIRRDVIARFGSFSMPLRTADSRKQTADSLAPSTAPRAGMLVLLRRPAFALAGVAAIAVGAVLAIQRNGWGPFKPPASSHQLPAVPAKVVAVAAPIVPGSGVAVSVFGLSPASSPQLPAASVNPVPTLRIRRTGRPINPASGVFDQWGGSVFSEEESLKSDREGGKNVFNS